MRSKQKMTSMLAVVVAVAPLQASIAQGPVFQGKGKVHYAKTEVEKATGKCKVAVIGGGLLGALIGAAAGGGRGAAIGGAGGLAVGTGACAIPMANAKHKDQIIAAQLAAAASDQPVTTSWTDDSGQTVSLVARRGDERQIDGAQLIPVKYSDTGGDTTAGIFAAGDKAMCRPVTSTVDGKPLPQQLTCRQPDGSYKPYQGPDIASTMIAPTTMICRFTDGASRPVRQAGDARPGRLLPTGPEHRRVTTMAA